MTPDSCTGWFTELTGGKAVYLGETRPYNSGLLYGLVYRIDWWESRYLGETRPYDSSCL
jgi:hypothetical protein